MATVPGNALQRRLHQQSLENKRQSLWDSQRIRGRIIEVYDPEFLSEVSNEKILNIVKSAPGILFAKVNIAEMDKDYIFPFAESAEQVLSTYGNHRNLNGRTVIVEWKGIDIKRGIVYLDNISQERLKNIDSSSNVYDIGIIL